MWIIVLIGLSAVFDDAFVNVALWVAGDIAWLLIVLALVRTGVGHRWVLPLGASTNVVAGLVLIGASDAVLHEPDNLSMLGGGMTLVILFGFVILQLDPPLAAAFTAVVAVAYLAVMVLQHSEDRMATTALWFMVVGVSAGEVVQAGVYALMANLTTTEMAAAFHPYLTMAEGLKLTAQTFDKDISRLSCCAAPVLAAPDQQLAITMYRLLARGEPVSARQAAEASGTAVDEIDRRLEAWPGVLRDENNNVIGFWGLALHEMHHQMTVDGTRLYTWCAWDPLFLSRILGDAEVATVDPTTGDQISYRIVDGAVTDLSHPHAVLSFLSPDEPWDDDIMGSFCHYVNNFVDAGSAERWTAEHPGTFAMSIADGVALAAVGPPAGSEPDGPGRPFSGRGSRRRPLARCR